jgi:hypothetical protein
MSGFVYFRSNGGERKLPDLVADLHGQIDFTLVGFENSVDICRARLEARVTMVAQNGKVRDLTQRIATTCGKR